MCQITKVKNVPLGSADVSIKSMVLAGHVGAGFESQESQSCGRRKRQADFYRVKLSLVYKETQEAIAT